MIIYAEEIYVKENYSDHISTLIVFSVGKQKIAEYVKLLPFNVNSIRYTGSDNENLLHTKNRSRILIF